MWLQKKKKKSRLSQSRLFKTCDPPWCEPRGWLWLKTNWSLAENMRINVSPRFEWQTTINQSAHIDKTQHSFDRCLYPTIQNYFLFVNSRSRKGPDWSYTSGRGKGSKQEGAATRFLDLTASFGALSLLRWHVNYEHHLVSPSSTVSLLEQLSSSHCVEIIRVDLLQR